MNACKTVAKSALLALGLLFSPEASAGGFLSGPSDAAFLNFGPLFSVTGRPSGTTYGLGGEVSLHYYPKGSEIFGVGLFTQLQATNQEHVRLAGGFQFTALVFGLEAGLAHEGANENYASTTSLHLAPFISGGYVSLGLRLGIPLSSSEPVPNYGSDIGLTVTLKYPLPLGKLRP